MNLYTPENVNVLVGGLANSKKVLELIIETHVSSDADDEALNSNDLFHEIVCESLHAYREICKVQDFVFGTGIIEHKYKVGEPEIIGADHLKIVK